MFLLITGASGVGKSTVRAVIEPELSPLVECVEARDLTQIPPFPTHAWRQRATEAVVRRALELQAAGRHLLLSGDPVAAAEVIAAPSATELEGMAFCLLDASPDVQAARLAGRGDDPALLHLHQAFAEWMRQQARDPLHALNVLSEGGWEEMHWERLSNWAPSWRMRVIDTSEMDRAAVGRVVLDWCREALGMPCAGAAKREIENVRGNAITRDCPGAGEWR